jgi:hypothetical protein
LLWLLLPIGYIVPILYDVKEFMLSFCLYPKRSRPTQGCRVNDDDDDDDDDISIPMCNRKGDVIEVQKWL